MNKKIMAGLAILFLVSIGTLTAVFAYKGQTNTNNPNYNAEVQAKLESAIENGDYDLWIQIRKDNNLPMNGRMFQAVNKDNFKTFSQMHEAMQSGDTEKADVLREELGLGHGMGTNKGIKETGNGINHAGHTCGNTGGCQMAANTNCPMHS